MNMKPDNKDYRHANLMGKNVATDVDAVHNMSKVISELGGTLHFIVEKYEDGWSAQCNELPGIMTGGEKVNITDEEIEVSIRAAIHAAFNISCLIPSEGIIRNAETPAFKTLTYA
jgi:hypothetical protein